MFVDRHKRAFALGGLALFALAFSGCSSPIADMRSLESPSDAPAKPKDPYLPVHDIPPDRDETLIPPDQRAKIEAELAAARDHQASAGQNSGTK
jgi:hypothetical protein